MSLPPAARAWLSTIRLPAAAMPLPPEQRKALIWLQILGASSVMAAWALSQQPWLTRILPPCQFKLATGFPCATCGLTRGIIHLMQGNLEAAWQYNPLSVIGVLGLLVWLWLAWLYPSLAIRTFRGLSSNRGLLVLAGGLLVLWLWKLCQPATTW
ncbi:MAG: DUF2752 domain-containing protein [Candidatus Melainabacteria bacterium]|nr:DUF2752 domain-containing protein [Candidatus Melainabacteria bacterium]